MNSVPIIEMQNISKRFSDKLVLDNISLDIQKGEVFGLIGPNGAGKSTLINILTGFIPKDHGVIRINGQEIKSSSVDYKRMLGLVPQDLALLETLNAYDNLEYFGVFYGLHGKALKKAIGEALEITGLSEHAKQKVSKFSGGMKRRLNMAAAIMHKPEILILDEPTVGVDPQSRNHIFEYIQDTNRKYGTTVIYTSHYMEEVEQLCERIFILDEGHKVSYGSIQEMKALLGSTKQIMVAVNALSPSFLEALPLLPCLKHSQQKGSKEIALTVENEFDLQALLGLCAVHNMSITNISVEEPSLEELFLTLTGKSLRD